MTPSRICVSRYADVVDVSVTTALLLRVGALYHVVATPRSTPDTQAAGIQVMKKGELKTKASDQPVSEFVQGVDPRRQDETNILLQLFAKITGEKPRIWNDMIGFGRYSYERSDGKTYEWFRTGFSPRKSRLTIYILPGYNMKQDLLDQLGKHKTGKSCLYINKLDDVDLAVLEQLVRTGYEELLEVAPR